MAGRYLQHGREREYHTIKSRGVATLLTGGSGVLPGLVRPVTFHGVKPPRKPAFWVRLSLTGAFFPTPGNGKQAFSELGHT
jgi:hypothetical protein